MKVIVNDANILIDLIDLGLINSFFELEYEFYTTSLIFEELLEDQQVELTTFVETEVLVVHEMTSDQLQEINNIQKNKPSLSQQDCSAFYQAQIEGGTLITSDNTLRKFATANELDVHGHLWVFDQMIDAQVITFTIAVEKLHELRETVNPNLGLPSNECATRIANWSI